jgi:hypothetical protein
MTQDLVGEQPPPKAVSPASVVRHPTFSVFV